jgi:hypothetical protein
MVGCTGTAPLGRTGILEAAGCEDGATTWRREYTSSGWVLLGAAAAPGAAAAAGVEEAACRTAAAADVEGEACWTAAAPGTVEGEACRAAAAPGAATATGIEGATCRAPDIGEGTLAGVGVVAVILMAAPALDATRGQSVRGADGVPTGETAHCHAGTPTEVPVGNKGVLGRGSISSVRKSKSVGWVGVGCWDMGKEFSSNTTWRDMRTRLV